jgi:dTDP-glucose 4,6-dehydratase
MERKRVLITGAAGFLGSHLCDRFIKEDFHVIGMDNLITGDMQNIEHLFKLENFEFYHHDVSKYVYVPNKVDYILHFASPASPIDYLKIPIQTLKVGSLGIHNLLGLARLKKARLLIASTSEVYGDPTVNPQPEEYWGNVNPVGPRGVYDEAKRFSGSDDNGLPHHSRFRNTDRKDF